MNAYYFDRSEGVERKVAEVTNLGYIRDRWTGHDIVKVRFTDGSTRSIRIDQIELR